MISTAKLASSPWVPSEHESMVNNSLELTDEIRSPVNFKLVIEMRTTVQVFVWHLFF